MQACDRDMLLVCTQHRLPYGKLSCRWEEGMKDVWKLLDELDEAADFRWVGSNTHCAGRGI